MAKITIQRQKMAWLTVEDAENGPVTFTVSKCEQVVKGPKDKPWTDMQGNPIQTLRLWFTEGEMNRYYDCWDFSECMFVSKQAGNGTPVEDTDDIAGQTFTVHGVAIVNQKTKSESTQLRLFRN